MRKPRVKKPRKLVPAKPRGQCVLCGGQLWTLGKPGDHKEGCPQGKGLETRRVKREELERVLSRLGKRGGREEARVVLVPPAVSALTPPAPMPEDLQTVEEAVNGSSLPLLFALPEVSPPPRRRGSNVGWTCPSCGRGVAPWVSQCPCAPAVLEVQEDRS